MSNIINSLKRLERIGSETSQQIDKLRTAMSTVSSKIANSFPFPDGTTLPRGYKVVKFPIEDAYCGPLPECTNALMYKGEILNNSDEYELFKQSPCEYGPGRDTILQFSKDIATGLIDEIAEFIEKENSTISQFTTTQLV